MGKIITLLTLVLFCSATDALAGNPNRARMIMLADMGNEPDEEQQNIHMIMCSNEFDLEGLIAVTGLYLSPNNNENEYKRVTHPELFLKIIDAYEKVYPNLQKHAEGWHHPDYLRSIIFSGQKGYGIGDVRKGKSSPGSECIIRAIEKNDRRPIWIVVNAGSNTLAQALYDYQDTHTKEELENAVKKLRVFENGSQDNAGAWICYNYPSIFWIRSNYQTYSYGGPGDKSLSEPIGPNFWSPYEYSSKGQSDWLKENVMNNHGPLGDIYPERIIFGNKVYPMEGGGTTPWMGLVNPGLLDIDHPSWAMLSG